MKKILLAGFGKISIMDEVNNGNEKFNLIFSDLFIDTLDILNHHVQTVVIHEDYFIAYEKEFKRFIRNHNETKYFIIVDPYDPKYVEQFHDEKYYIYSLKTYQMTLDFLMNLISFSEELDSTYQYKDLIIDYPKKEVSIHGKCLILTPMEFDLLIYLKIHATMTLSRNDLIHAVWGYSFLGDSRTIDTHIKSLRRKLGPYRSLIKTVWGKGYTFQES